MVSMSSGSLTISPMTTSMGAPIGARIVSARRIVAIEILSSCHRAAKSSSKSRVRAPGMDIVSEQNKICACEERSISHNPGFTNDVQLYSYRFRLRIRGDKLQDKLFRPISNHSIDVH